MFVTLRDLFTNHVQSLVKKKHVISELVSRKWPQKCLLGGYKGMKHGHSMRYPKSFQVACIHMQLLGAKIL